MGRNFNILEELRDMNAGFLLRENRGNLFFVPENYFNELPVTIHANIFLNSIKASNPFSVPEGYFENFPGLMLIKLKGDAEVNMFRNNNQPVYSVPENYFDNFASEVLKKIKQPSRVSVHQELEEISPFLSAIPRTNVYSVPENYFGNLNTNVPVQSPAKVISIGSRTRKWANYAAAACVAALLFGGSFLHFYKKGSAEIPPVASTVSAEDLQKQISVLSDDEINNYLKTNSNLAVFSNVGTDEYQQQNLDIQNMLQNVSDDEIQQYLDQNPESSSTGEGI